SYKNILFNIKLLTLAIGTVKMLNKTLIICFCFVILTPSMMASPINNYENNQRCAETNQICGGFAGVICCDQRDYCKYDLGSAGHCTRSSVTSIIR
ncbi:hypothetical protein BLOT_013087, partial [Blomia tropicalis]